MKLNVTDIAYDGKVLFNDEGMGVILSSTEDNLLYVAGYAEALYTAWAEEIKKLPGVECQMSGESPSRFGYCVTWVDCKEIWPLMKDLTIRIDDVVYTLPPQA